MNTDSIEINDIFCFIKSNNKAPFLPYKLYKLISIDYVNASNWAKKNYIEYTRYNIKPCNTESIFGLEYKKSQDIFKNIHNRNVHKAIKLSNVDPSFTEDKLIRLDQMLNSNDEITKNMATITLINFIKKYYNININKLTSTNI